MRTFILLIAVFAAAIYSYTTQKQSVPADRPAAQQTSQADPVGVLNEAIENAIANQQSNVPVRASAVVEKILGDDNQGSRHQRFIVRLPSGNTVLIAHNIDLASRVATLSVGDRVEFSGEYEWNNKGGVVHWTHRDPGGKHAAGWIKHGGQTFQ